MLDGRPAHPRSAADTEFPWRLPDTPNPIRPSAAASCYNNFMSSCPDCGLDLDHCHGTLVVHSDRTSECTDPGCAVPDLLMHAFVIDCRAVSGGCCVTDQPLELRVAS